MTEETQKPVRKPAALFPDADTALASGDTRKLYELSFTGIPGSVYCYAISEHQAQLAFIKSVTTIRKVNRADRAKMIAEAYSKLLKEKSAQKAAPVSEVAEQDKMKFQDAAL